MMENCPLKKMISIQKWPFIVKLAVVRSSCGGDCRCTLCCGAVSFIGGSWPAPALSSDVLPAAAAAGVKTGSGLY